ncbi:hypothetical protein HDF16_005013 [Granulicella aggregans]|uniref:VWFA domain-containing protein n=1 Tax=Granulicella aggregans TaxID=474949 RepID=A0A7W7ZI14_9BACT|nr:hypothetical protein [Granulicella aggregans]
MHFVRACCLTLSVAVCAGQSVDSRQPYTFHAYTDVVQVPTMVLTPMRASYPSLSVDSFSVSFDSGPVSHPEHVRLEGDDPLQFAVLLDVSQENGRWLAKSLVNARGQLVPELFNGGDRISVFASDCVLIRSREATPASIPELHAGIKDVLASTALHQSDQGSNCGEKHRLWDVIASTITQLQPLQGRRVLMVLSDGVDRGSKLTWEEVRRYAVRSGVTIMGIRPTQGGAPSSMFAPDKRQPSKTVAEDIFAIFCGGTGGIAFYDTPKTVDSTFIRAVSLIRKRYILEFVSPTNATAGDHSIDISIPDHRAIVRVTGATFLLHHQEIGEDPSVIPSNDSNAPQFGKRKILVQPQSR